MKTLFLLSAIMCLYICAFSQKRIINTVDAFEDYKIVYTQEDSLARLIVILNTIEGDSALEDQASKALDISLSGDIVWNKHSENPQKNRLKRVKLKPISKERPFALYADLADGTGEPLANRSDSQQWKWVEFRLQHSLRGDPVLEERVRLYPPKPQDDAFDLYIHVPKRLMRLGKHGGLVKLHSTPYGLPFVVTAFEFTRITEGHKYLHQLDKSHLENDQAYNGILETAFVTDFEIEADGMSTFLLVVRGHLLGKERQLIQSKPQPVEFVSIKNVDKRVKNRPMNFKIEFPKKTKVFFDRGVQTWREVELGIYFFDEEYKQIKITSIPQGNNRYDIKMEGLDKIKEGTSSSFYYIDKETNQRISDTYIIRKNLKEKNEIQRK